TTSILLAFEDGTTGFVSCMSATAPTYRFCVYGSKGVAEIRGQGLDHFDFSPTPDAPLGGHAVAKPIKTSTLPGVDTVPLELAAFSVAVCMDHSFKIMHAQMVHGAAVFGAVTRSEAERTRFTLWRQQPR